jgi:hypothetical protein
MHNTNVLISGASVAGPALAYWLGRYGFQPTVVEEAPALRGGGYAVDFRGPAHLQVLERMGVLEELRRLQTGGSPLRFVDETGRQLLYLPGEFAGGDVEILRSDLSRVLYEHSRDTTEYLFGDSIAAMTQTADSVQVSFERGAERTFDLVPIPATFALLGHTPAHSCRWVGRTGGRAGPGAGDHQCGRQSAAADPASLQRVGGDLAAGADDLAVSPGHACSADRRGDLHQCRPGP